MDTQLHFFFEKKKKKHAQRKYRGCHFYSVSDYNLLSIKEEAPFLIDVWRRELKKYCHEMVTCHGNLPIYGCRGYSVKKKTGLKALLLCPTDETTPLNIQYVCTAIQQNYDSKLRLVLLWENMLTS